VGLFFGLSSVLFYGLLTGLRDGLIEGAIAAFRAGLSIALTFVLLRG
jgi:hypothetical protein